ncbi:MAG: glycosyltransferase family 1 protein [Candidatus Microsaccharimonas sp.]
MKIRIEVNSLATKNLSGVGYFTKRLAESFIQKKNVDVSVFSFNFLGRQPTPSIIGEGSQEVNYLFPLRIYAKLQSYKLAFPFDIGLKPTDLTIFTNYARLPSIKSRYTATVIHDLTFVKYPELMEEKNLAHLNRVVKRSIDASDFIITVSEAVKAELVQEYSLNPDNVIATPVPPDEIFYKKNNNEIHKKYNIPTKNYLFFISTIEPRKNIPILVDAYTRLPRTIQAKYSLVISGGMGWKSEETTAVLKKAHEEGLNVIHTGYIDEQDKSALYQQSSAFVFPSIYEGFGMPILEAAASKTPIITADIPVLREAAGDGALYFNPNDSSSLVLAIQKILGDKVLRRDLTTKASKHLKTFSWSDNAEKIIDKISELERSHKNRR